MFNNQLFYTETSDYNHLYQRCWSNLQPLPSLSMPPASATSSAQSGPQNWTSGQHNQSYQPSQFFNQPNWSDLKIKNEKIDEADNEAKTNPKPEQSMQAMGHLAYLPGEKFDPSTTSFSHDELRPAPIIPKRKKVTFCDL